MKPERTANNRLDNVLWSDRYVLVAAVRDGRQLGWLGVRFRTFTPTEELRAGP